MDVSLPHSPYALAAYYIVAPAEASSNLARFDGMHYGHRTKEKVDLISTYSKSRGEAFGLVLLEALASGVPVAAFPVTGPIDVAADPTIGCLDADLAKAAIAALSKRPEDCRAYAEGFSWRACAEMFLGNLHLYEPAVRHGRACAETPA